MAANEGEERGREGGMEKNKKEIKQIGTECAAQMNALVPVQGLANFCHQSLEFPLGGCHPQNVTKPASFPISLIISP
jgi:hypothetical protein